MVCWQIYIRQIFDKWEISCLLCRAYDPKNDKMPLSAKFPARWSLNRTKTNRIAWPEYKWPQGTMHVLRKSENNSCGGH